MFVLLRREDSKVSRFLLTIPLTDFWPNYFFSEWLLIPPENSSELIIKVKIIIEKVRSHAFKISYTTFGSFLDFQDKLQSGCRTVPDW